MSDQEEELGFPLEDLYGMPIRLYKHIFEGRKCGRGGVLGVHHVQALTRKASNFEVGDIRSYPDSKVLRKNEFYEMEIGYWDGTEWIKKTEKGEAVKSSFFPDAWSVRRVMEEIAIASAKVKPTDWQPPVFPQKKSNSYLQTLTNGQEVIFYIGDTRKNPPKKVGKYIASVFPYFGE